MGKTTAWTEDENRALCSLYFRMLDGSLRTDGRLNKAALVRLARGEPKETDRNVTGCAGFGWLLKGRSKQSVEFKLMNATAAHASLDPQAVTMDGHGYRAMANYQAALKDAGRTALEGRAIFSDYDLNDGARDHRERSA